jgi:hypothetical protein
MGAAVGRLGWALAAALALGALAGAPARAVVACQKGKQVKLRGEACKARETLAVDFGRDPTGIWQYTGSEGRGGSLGTPFLGTNLTPRFLTLEADGRARVNLENESSGALACADFPWARGASPAVTFDLTRVQYQGTRVLRTAMPTADELRLTDNLGVTLAFSRAASVPADAECAALTEQQRFTGLPRPSGVSGLAYDGVSLWYSDDGSTAYPVDPATGAVGTPVDLGFVSFSYVHAVQAGDFWTHCWCGGNEVATRLTPGGSEVDSVDTRADLGDPINVRALAFDAAEGALWLYGRSSDSYEGRLLRALTDLEPDQLQLGGPFATPLAALAFDGSVLWGLTEDAPRSVVRIDPLAGNATATFTIPDPSVEWVGIASVGGQLFLLGATGGEGPGEGILATFAPTP